MDIKENNTLSKLVIKIFDADNLLAGDINGLSDPYVIVNFSNLQKKTSVISKTLNPEWNEALTFRENMSCWFLPEDTLSFTVLDHDIVGHHDILGTLQLPLWELLEKSTQIPIDRTRHLKANSSSSLNGPSIVSEENHSSFSGVDDFSEAASNSSLSVSDSEKGDGDTLSWSEGHEEQEIVFKGEPPRYFFKLEPQKFLLHLDDSQRYISSTLRFGLEFHLGINFDMKAHPQFSKVPRVIGLRKQPKLHRLCMKVHEARRWQSKKAFEGKRLLDETISSIHFSILRGKDLDYRGIRETYQKVHIEAVFRDEVVYSKFYHFSQNPLFNSNFAFGEGFYQPLIMDDVKLRVVLTRKEEKLKRIRRSEVILGELVIPFYTLVENVEDKIDILSWFTLLPPRSVSINGKSYPKLLIRIRTKGTASETLRIPRFISGMPTITYNINVSLLCVKNLLELLKKSSKNKGSNILLEKQKYYAVISCGVMRNRQKILPLNTETVGFPLFAHNKCKLFVESSVQTLQGLSSEESIVIELKRSIPIVENRNRFRFGPRFRGKKEATELLATLVVDISQLIESVGYIDDDGKTLGKVLAMTPNLSKSGLQSVTDISKITPEAKLSFFIKPVRRTFFNAATVISFNFLKLSLLRGTNYKKFYLSVSYNESSKVFMSRIFSMQSSCTDINAPVLLDFDHAVGEMPKELNLALCCSNTKRILARGRLSNSVGEKENIENIKLFSNIDEELGLFATLLVRKRNLIRPQEQIPLLGHITLSPSSILKAKESFDIKRMRRMLIICDADGERYSCVFNRGSICLPVYFMRSMFTLKLVELLDEISSDQLVEDESEVLAEGVLSPFEVIEFESPSGEPNYPKRLKLKSSGSKGELFGFLEFQAHFEERIAGSLATFDAIQHAATQVEEDDEKGESGLALMKAFVNEAGRTAKILDWAVQFPVSRLRYIMQWNNFQTTLAVLIMGSLICLDPFLWSRQLLLFPVCSLVYIWTTSRKQHSLQLQRQNFELKEDDTKLKVSLCVTEFYNNVSERTIEERKGWKIELYKYSERVIREKQTLAYAIEENERFAKSYLVGENITIFPDRTNHINYTELKVVVESMSYSDEFKNLTAPRVTHLSMSRKQNGRKYDSNLVLLQNLRRRQSTQIGEKGKFSFVNCTLDDLLHLESFEFILESVENNTSFFCSVSSVLVLDSIRNKARTDSFARGLVEFSIPIFFSKGSSTQVGQTTVFFYLNKLLRLGVLKENADDICTESDFSTGYVLDGNPQVREYDDLFTEHSWLFNNDAIVLKFSKKMLVKNETGNNEKEPYLEEYVDKGQLLLRIGDIIERGHPSISIDPAKLSFSISEQLNLSSYLLVNLAIDVKLPKEGILDKYKYQEEIRKASAINFWDIMKVKRVFQSKLVFFLSRLQTFNDTSEKVKNLFNWTHPRKTRFIAQVLSLWIIVSFLIPSRLIVVFGFLFLLTEHFRPKGVVVTKLKHFLNLVPTDLELKEIYDSKNVVSIESQSGTAVEASPQAQVAHKSVKNKILARATTGGKLKLLGQKSSREAFKHSVKNAKAKHGMVWSNFKRAISKSAK
eukprot:snap_masked-scaffold_20-processed-gene-5.101-mRNA-1 protein AED:0.47 eAED:0.47 QI:0/-1/0/1/-1/1/1/0/1572